MYSRHLNPIPKDRFLVLDVSQGLCSFETQWHKRGSLINCTILAAAVRGGIQSQHTELDLNGVQASL